MFQDIINIAQCSHHQLKLHLEGSQITSGVPMSTICHNPLCSMDSLQQPPQLGHRFLQVGDTPGRGTPRLLELAKSSPRPGSYVCGREKRESGDHHDAIGEKVIVTSVVWKKRICTAESNSYLDRPFQRGRATNSQELLESTTPGRRLYRAAEVLSSGAKMRYKGCGHIVLISTITDRIYR